MVPTLARRGTLVLASAATFMIVGAMYGQAPIVVLGGLALSALMTAYLWFFPAAILLRRRTIELSWWVPPSDQAGGALTVDRPFALHLALRNHGARRLRVLEIDVLGGPAIEPPRGLEAVVPPGRQVEVIGEVRARAAGHQVMHGAVLGLGDVLGLFELRAYFPNPIGIKVFPRDSAGHAGGALAPRGAPVDERIGRHVLRRRGVAGELRELREHGMGDPFKLIAWKATARRGKLMVRDLETEIVATHELVLDIGGGMRGGPPGRTRLDAAIELCAGLARAALEGGDRVGLTTFDTRVYSALAPGEGRRHLHAVIDRLLETRDVVDEDLTDLTCGELVGAVATYLAHQEGLDVRLRRAPSLDDPMWEGIQAGPSGELYDLAALDAAIGRLLADLDGGRAAPSWWARPQVGVDGDPRHARLRRFCRLRGIELPYRRAPERGARGAGLVAALRRVAGTRVASLLLVSDLGGLAEASDEALALLARARRGGARVAAIVPSEARLIAPPATPTGQRVLDAVLAAEAGALEERRALLARRGIAVIELGPGDGAGSIAARLSRRRALRRAA